MKQGLKIFFVPFGLCLAGWLFPSELPAAPPPPGQASLLLAWNYGSGNETGFGIDRATSLNGPWATIATVPVPLTSYLDTGLRFSTVYYYRVWAYNSAGRSDYSNVADITTPPRPDKPGTRPTRPTGTPGGGGSATNRPVHRPVHGLAHPPTVTTNLIPPFIRALGRNGNRTLVSFNGTNGLRYTLEYKNSLTDSTWTPLAGAVIGTNGMASLTDSNAPTTSRFYRIQANSAQ